jgi:hypothetical protein
LLTVYLLTFLWLDMAGFMAESFNIKSLVIAPDKGTWYAVS